MRTPVSGNSIAGHAERPRRQRGRGRSNSTHHLVTDVSVVHLCPHRQHDKHALVKRVFA
jgi:hypothetical protein